jgi:Fur family ferric uptake transcriptional regulator
MPRTLDDDEIHSHFVAPSDYACPVAHDDWLEHATARLAAEGHRAGGARRQVMELLAGQHCCRSAQELHAELRETDRRVGLASVYRALETLADLGLVHRLDVAGAAAYEPALPGGEHHHHLVCSTCGRVDTFEDDALEDAIATLATRVGYAVSEHDVVLRGACARCAG